MTISTRRRTGLALALFLSAANIASIATPTPDGETGPPLGVVIGGAALGLVGIAAATAAWRSNKRTMLGVTSGLIVVMALLGLPALFVDVPTALKVLVGISIALTATAVALIHAGRGAEPAVATPKVDVAA